MATVSEALAAARRSLAAGRLAATEEIARRIIQSDPDRAEAWHLLGAVAERTGRLQTAAECLESACRISPAVDIFHADLARVYRRLGRIAEAAACLDRAIALAPDNADALCNRGILAKDAGRPAEAEAWYRRALECQPGLARAWFNLGNLLREQGQPAEASDAYRAALAIDPRSADAQNNLGLVLKIQGDYAGAVAAFQEALRLQPDFLAAIINLGQLWCLQGQVEAGMAGLRRAVELAPDADDARASLVAALLDASRSSEALATAEEGVRRQPASAAAHDTLGSVQLGRGLLTDALASYERAIALRPAWTQPYNNRGVVLKHSGRIPEAILAFQRALELEPGQAEAQSRLLFAMQYGEDVTPARLAAAHADYQRRHSASQPVAGRRSPIGYDPDRPLRIGLLSPDLGCHPVGFFLIPLVENAAGQRLETVCYSDRAAGDAMTRRFQAAATQWHSTVLWSDRRVADQIAADRIDVLFDLAGHTAAGRRLAVLDDRAAPLQVAWLGHEGTTGLSAIDCLLADRHTIPETAQADYREKILRMPHSYVCYDPLRAAPDVGPLPALANGHVTLGSFNNLAKVNPSVVAAWAAILRRLPQARLRLKYFGLQDPAVRRRYMDLFAQQGVAAERIDLGRDTSYEDYLAAFNGIDLALDPFPFSGGATTCDALWMGVPVITWPGETFAGRHSLSYLSTIGLAETIAGNRDEYVELAVRLASDLPRLAALRRQLRPQMAASPLCDGPRFAADLAGVLRAEISASSAGKGPG